MTADSIQVLAPPYFTSAGDAVAAEAPESRVTAEISLKSAGPRCSPSSGSPSTSCSSSLVLSSPLLAPNFRKIFNWARTQIWTPKHFEQPQTYEEVSRIVKLATAQGLKVKVVGTGHSPSNIAVCDDLVISIERLNRILSVSADTKRVTFQAGISVRELNAQLPRHGLALRNHSSISDQSFAGLISTGSHGTGINFDVFGADVVSLKIVLASGDLVACSATERADLLAAARCGIGALGVIVECEVQCEEFYHLRAETRPESLATVLRHYPEWLQQSDHVRFWWIPHTDQCTVWHASRDRSPDLAAGPAVGGAARPLLRRPFWSSSLIQRSPRLNKLVGFHLLQFLYFVGLSVPRIVPYVNRFYRWLSFTATSDIIDRAEVVTNFDCLFQQHVSEWAVPIQHTAAVLESLATLIARNKLNVHLPVECRFVKGSCPDHVWLSPTVGVDSLLLGIIMYKPFGFDPDYKRYFALFEELMLSFGGRPHWAKDFNAVPDVLAHSYPMWHRFAALRHSLDPTGTFCNPWLARLFPPTARSVAARVASRVEIEKS